MNNWDINENILGGIPTVRGTRFSVSQLVVEVIDSITEDGIRDFCLSRGLGDVYKRQNHCLVPSCLKAVDQRVHYICTVSAKLIWQIVWTI